MFVRCINRIATLAKIRKIYNNSEKKSMWVDFYFEANALCLGESLNNHYATTLLRYSINVRFSVFGG